MKTLYFEGAGCVPRGEVENCRIRTAFRNDEGKAIYLEIIGVETTKHSPSRYNHYTNYGFVDHCHYITGDHDDCNNHTLPQERNTNFEYTKANILAFVNSLGCSFDQIVVLPNLAGYRVHTDDRGYNFGDEFQYNEERTVRAEEIHKHFYDLEKSEGKKFPNLSLWVDEQNPELLHLLRHFNGYNKHWNIQNIENWQDTVVETPLGKYGC